tara:strand:+ start:113 stop:283 length:171 start_codon:yes stop_codon:yes gene_type:complete
MTGKIRSKEILKKRIAELEVRLDNLHILVTNIAHNQDAIVAALTPNEEDKPEDKEQ